MNLSRRISRWFVLSAIAAAIPAGAAPLPSASTSVFCSVEGNSFMNPTSCEFGGFPGVASSARAEVNLNPVPHVLATATTPPAGVLGAGSSATALYYFQVAGPIDGELVPLLFDIYLLSEGTFDANAIARVLINSTSAPSQVFEVCSDGTCDETQISETVELQVRTGALFDSITLFAQAQAFVTRSTTETALAVADPYIYIHPAFPNAHLYSVIVSPGVGNAPTDTVPEPATLGLAGAVLGWMGLRRALRR